MRSSMILVILLVTSLAQAGVFAPPEKLAALSEIVVPAGSNHVFLLDSADGFCSLQTDVRGYDREIRATSEFTLESVSSVGLITMTVEELYKTLQRSLPGMENIPFSKFSTDIYMGMSWSDVKKVLNNKYMIGATGPNQWPVLNSYQLRLNSASTGKYYSMTCDLQKAVSTDLEMLNLLSKSSLVPVPAL